MKRAEFGAALVDTVVPSRHHGEINLGGDGGDNTGAPLTAVAAFATGDGGNPAVTWTMASRGDDGVDRVAAMTVRWW